MDIKNVINCFFFHKPTKHLTSRNLSNSSEVLRSTRAALFAMISDETEQSYVFHNFFLQVNEVKINDLVISACRQTEIS